MNIKATVFCVCWPAVVLSGTCALAERTSVGSEPPLNVVLVTISSLRADHVSCLGYGRATTPEFDKFAQEGTLFTRAYATSGWTMPSHASIFTSRFPRDHKVTHIDHSLDGRFTTLAEILRDKGFRCAGFCCGPRVDCAHGFNQGFEFYDDFSVQVMLSAISGVSADINKNRTNDLVNEAAMKWLSKNRKSPFFMFVHYYDSHWDYLPPAPYDRLFDPDYKGQMNGVSVSREPLFSNPPGQRDIEHMIALYDGEVRQTDKDLGELLGFLRGEGLLERSIVIIVGDHGEQFYEHGHTSHHGVHEELVHVPMLIRVPDRKGYTKKSDALVSTVDILPTVLEYANIKKPAQCAGVGLKPIMEGKADRVHEYVWTEYTGGAVADSWAVRTTRLTCYKEKGRKPVIFDRAKDPDEQYEIHSKDFTREMTALSGVLTKWTQ